MINDLKNNYYLYLLFLIVFITNGCAYHNIEELKATPKSNNQFSQALSDNYLEFALYEMNEMHDEYDAAYFAKKGIQAKKNLNIQPELISNWDIDEEYRNLALQKRKELIDALKSKRASNLPNVSARTQLGYDCWLEQLEEAWQTQHIKKCFDMLNSGLHILGQDTIHNIEVVKNIDTKHSKFIKEKDIEETKSIKEIKKIDDISSKIKFEIYFDHNVYKLNNENKNTLQNLHEKKNITNNFIIEVIGHTDRSGSEEYNILLSKLRANEVKKFLIQLGIKDQNITSYYFGESKLKISTKDGVREKMNRRVELFINKN